jgi:manganese/zinc/iron transport system permease protein
MTATDLWTILVAMLANVSCAVVGCYLVLRRMSLLGDAISHAVLPGIALAFLLTGQITGPAIVLGAMAVGVLTALLTQVISQAAKVPEDASLGVVFTALFALGVVLISVASSAKHVDLDPGCVLYGLIEAAPLDVTTLAGLLVPRSLITLVFALALVAVVLALFWKEFKLATFDPALATALGFSALLMHYLMMALVAAVTVAAFEAVGSILVVAMLIVPAATALLLTDRYGMMFVWTIVAAALSAVSGYYGALALNTSVAGMMAVCAGALFVVALLLAPRHGLAARVIRQLRLALRIIREDILGFLYRAEEARGSAAGLPESGRFPAHSTPLSRLALWQLFRRGMLEPSTGGYQLTQSGRRYAAQLVRAHRLWETFLEQNVALPPDHLHAAAEKMEHYVGPNLLHTLAQETHEPVLDPHGRVIPGRTTADTEKP